MPVLELVPFSAANTDLVLGWRNSPRVRANMIDDSVISKETHGAFLRALETDPSRAYYVINLDDLPVAVLSFINLGQPDVAWGCYIGTDKMIPGLFVAMFVIAADKAFASPETMALCSEVAVHNAAPQRFNRFVGLEYRQSYTRTTSSGVSVEFRSFRLERFRHQEIVAKALGIMPGSMKNAYEYWKAEN